MTGIPLAVPDNTVPTVGDVILRVVDVYTFEHLYDCLFPCGIGHFEIINGILTLYYYGTNYYHGAEQNTHIAYYKLLDEWIVII